MANIFTNLFSRREITPGIVKTTDPDDPSNQVAKGGNWESKIIRPYGRTSLLVPAWYRGVSLIMQTMGQMKVQYQRMSDGGNYTESRYGDGRRLNYLLQIRPNPLMTAAVMQEQIEYRKIYFGNAFVYIERDEYGWPQALWLCNGGSYNPMTDEFTLSYYGTDGPHLRFDAPSKDVMHFKNVFLTDDFFMGIPTLDFAYKTLSIAATADEQTLQDVAKGGRMKILVQEREEKNNGGGLLAGGRVNTKELKKAANDLDEDIYSKDVAMLTNMADAKVISQTSQQLQLLEERSFSVSDLARILGIPRIMMMEDAGSSYKMPEHATQEFLLRTIQPRMREMEDELNSKLLLYEDFGYRRIHVCELALRRLDAKGQAEIDKIHLETGVNTVNELRNMYDYPAVEGGDKNYISTNLAELGSDKLRQSANSGAGAGEGAGNE